MSAPRVRVAVGTCGFSYDDWVGPVYPPGTRRDEMLAWYTRLFPVVEIDTTYYHVPKPRIFAAMAARTPPAFRFTAKLPGSATHVPPEAAGAVHPDISAFREAIEPLVAAGKFAAALMQFPTSFHANEATRDHIVALRSALPDLPLVAEFRHNEWQTAETADLLRELRIGTVNVDQPHFPTTMRPTTDVTSETAYVRLHGRNAQQWWRGTAETRFDYLYGPDELEPWADRVVDLTASAGVREVLTFFNNHRRGQAARNAEMFEAMMRERLPPDALTIVPREALPQALTLPFDDMP